MRERSGGVTDADRTFEPVNHPPVPVRACAA